MKDILTLKTFAIFALAACFALAGCDNSSKAARKGQVKKPAAVAVPEKKPEPPKVEEPKGPIQDKHFIFVDFPKGELKTGSVLEASIDIQIPFENPFNSQDAYVEAYISGEKNGVSVNMPMYYVSGNQEKSTWKLRFPLSKVGSYKCSFSVRAKNSTYVSLEHAFNVSEGDGAPYFKLSRKMRSCFRNGKGDRLRAMGGNLYISMDDASRDALLDKLKRAGANVVRIFIEAPHSMFIAKDGETAKAGWINIAAANKIESFMDAAYSRGIYTIINFASPASFRSDVYAGCYFAESGIAKTPKDFFSSFDAQQKYSELLTYMGHRFGARADLLMWEMFSGLDAFDMADFDARMNWLTTLSVVLRDADVHSEHPLLLSAGTSSEFDFIWSGDSCSVMMFDIYDVEDFALSVVSHDRFFSRRYKKATGVSSFGKHSERFSLPEPSNIYIHNTMWAGLFTGGPILPLVNLGDAALLECNLKALGEVSAFSQKFGIEEERLEMAYSGDMVLVSAKKPLENMIFCQPAFGETVVERETSNDIAELILAADGTVYKNTVPRVWKNGAIITLKVRGVPESKATLSFDVVSMPADSQGKMIINLNDDELKTETFAPGAKKTIRTEGGREKSYINKTVEVPLEQGDQTVGIIVEGENASFDIANIRVVGMGSNKGFASVRAYSLRSKDDGRRFLWFKRAGTDNASVAKYKLYERDIPELRSFEYPVKFENKGGRDFKVTWWDTRNNTVLSEGVIKCAPDSFLKLRVPPFKFDIACAISGIKAPGKEDSKPGDSGAKK